MCQSWICVALSRTWGWISWVFGSSFRWFKVALFFSSHASSHWWWFFFFLTYETQFWCFRMNSLLYTLGVATTKGLISALCFYIAHLSPVCVINNVWCVCIVFIFTLFSSPWLIWARSYKKIIRKIFFNFCTQFFQTGSASVPLWHALLFKRLLVYLLLFVIGTVGWTLNGYSWWQAIFVYFCF